MRWRPVGEASRARTAKVCRLSRARDRRHRFAIKALEACADGRDRVTRHMLALSTYLGHARLEDTYWYLENTPQLMTDIAEACESFMQGAIR
jgi:integrase/recombinase XerD